MKIKLNPEIKLELERILIANRLMARSIENIEILDSEKNLNVEQFKIHLDEITLDIEFILEQADFND